MKLQQIIQLGYRKITESKALPVHVRHAAELIGKCRTAALGGHVQGCPEGHYQRIWYNSCKHRACPQCAFVEIQEWLDRQKARILACEHYHVIFTLPGELDALWLANVGPMTELLFRAARDTLFELLRDRRHLGADPGVILVRHTWGQTLVLHPHVHCLVTGGGLTAEGSWRGVRNGYLVPGRVARDLFRGKFLAGVRGSLQAGELAVPAGARRQPALNLVNQLGRKKWNASIREKYAHGNGVLIYLARYMRGGPITDRRIVEADSERVRFRYKDYRSTKPSGRAARSVMDLPIEQFVGRLLLHVPLPGQKLVRSYGLYAGSRAKDLARCRGLLGQGPVGEPERRDWQACVRGLGPEHPERCPVCGVPLVRRELVAPEPGRPAKLPPMAAAA